MSARLSISAPRLVRRPSFQPGEMPLARAHAWSLAHYFLERGAARVSVDGAEREIDLGRAFSDYFDVLAARPPAADRPPAERALLLAERSARKLDAALGAPLDALAEDWRRHVLSLRPPPIARYDPEARRFVSERFGFGVPTPTASGWAATAERTEGDEAVRMEHPATGATISVRVRGNAENDATEEVKDRAVARLSPRRVRPAPVTEEERPVSGLDAGREVAVAGLASPGGEEGAVRLLVVGSPALRYIYEVECACEAARVAESRAAFDEVIRGFELLPPE